MNEPISFEWSPSDIAMFDDYLAEQELVKRRKQIGALETYQQAEDAYRAARGIPLRERLTITEYVPSPESLAAVKTYPLPDSDGIGLMRVVMAYLGFVLGVAIVVIAVLRLGAR